jgi:hypothetical protein
MEKKGRIGIIIIVIVIVLILAVGSYFIFFREKCSKEELFNPYSDICVSKNVLCNLNSDCTLLEGQTVSFSGENLIFTLVSAKEGADDSAIININGAGEVSLTNAIEQSSFSFSNYVINFESADGDADKIMGASFEITNA